MGSGSCSLQLFIRNIHRRFIPKKHFLFCPFSVIHIIRRFQILIVALLSIYIMETVIGIHLVNLNLFFRNFPSSSSTHGNMPYLFLNLISYKHNANIVTSKIHVMKTFNYNFHIQITFLFTREACTRFLSLRNFTKYTV